MGLIHELSYNTVVKIAAGEVIERPASVVRELLDNSIDAGADFIRVLISNGGISYIEVQDNGKGMDIEDLLICTKNHTTSKIKSFEDIYALGTLGFRGEALSSITEVARVSILSRNSSLIQGYRIEIGDGSVSPPLPAGMNSGTTVIVRDLFYNTPARLKFLGSKGSEQRLIDREIIKKALAYPEIGFEFISEGRRKYISPVKETYLERIADFYPDTLDYLIPVEGISSHFSISGFVTRTVFLRPNRMYQSVYVNRRAVEWKNFYFAVSGAYGNLIPRGYFPGAFIFITVDPEYVDVNVHPMKKEVRFREDSLLTGAVGDAVRKALMAEMPVSPSDSGPISFTPFERRVSSAITSFMENKDGIKGSSGRSPAQELWEKVSVKEQQFKISECRYIGTVFMTYLIFENENDMILIDQHAAHERINYEKIRDNFEKHLLSVQEFLTPVSIDVPAGIIDGLKSNLPLLLSMGFQVEHFGGSRFIITGAPPFIDYRDSADAVMGFVETLEENPSTLTGTGSTLDFIDDAIKQMACKKSVRAGEQLSREEAVALVTEWENTANPYSCPHGRPVAFSISKHNIEKQFCRLGFKNQDFVNSIK